jgi:hypothetical protein
MMMVIRDKWQIFNHVSSVTDNIATRWTQRVKTICLSKIPGLTDVVHRHQKIEFSRPSIYFFAKELMYRYYFFQTNCRHVVRRCFHSQSCNQEANYST